MRKLMAEIYYDPDTYVWSIEWADKWATSSAPNDSFEDLMKQHHHHRLREAYMRVVDNSP